MLSGTFCKYLCDLQDTAQFDVLQSQQPPCSTAAPVRAPIFQTGPGSLPGCDLLIALLTSLGVLCRTACSQCAARGGRGFKESNSVKHSEGFMSSVMCRKQQKEKLR